MEEVASLTKAKSAIRKGKNVELIYSEKSVVQIKITAPLMEEYAGKENYIEMRQGIKATFYDSLMQVSSTLTSKYAIHLVDKQKMEAKDDVEIINNKGEKLNTEHLIWLQDSAKIYSDEFVKITTENEIIMGEGLEANQDFSQWKIHQITGIINLTEEKDSLTNKK
ncbi:MAG: LPS export ABC transporter periplasmic protein LptC [Vicingus serpentipes]|nr:LPS export ABC transporter periplasmic protein LptC [Vicingus serpentipes]